MDVPRRQLLRLSEPTFNVAPDGFRTLAHFPRPVFRAVAQTATPCRTPAARCVLVGVALVTVAFSASCSPVGGEAPAPEVRYVGYGAQQTVSGSLHALEVHGRYYVVDVGSFMGEEGENHPWPEDLPVDRIEAVFLTHAHPDHIGRLPLLLREGYRGPIYLTRPTLDLAEIALEANVAFTDLGPEQFHYSRRNRGEERIPVWPDGYDLGRFTVAEENRIEVEARRPELDSLGYFLPATARGVLAEEVLTPLRDQAVVLGLEEKVEVDPFEASFVHTAHIPGSVMVRLEIDGQVLAFTGDFGGNRHPLLSPNEPWQGELDVLFVEGTYVVRVFGDAGPDQIVLVHLEPENISVLKERYGEAFGAEVVAPGVGEHLRLLPN